MTVRGERPAARERQTGRATPPLPSFFPAARRSAGPEASRQSPPLPPLGTRRACSPAHDPNDPAPPATSGRNRAVAPWAGRRRPTPRDRTEQPPMTRTILTLALLAAACPALADEAVRAGPAQAVMRPLGGERVLAYYVPAAGRCDTVVMPGEEPGPRLRVSLAPAEAATVEDAGGGSLVLTCGPAAAWMTVERHAPAQETASAG